MTPRMNTDQTHDLATLPDAIVAAIELAGSNRNQVGEISGIGAQGMYGLVRGRARHPSTLQVERIAEATGCVIAYTPGVGWVAERP